MEVNRHRLFPKRQVGGTPTAAIAKAMQAARRRPREAMMMRVPAAPQEGGRSHALACCKQKSVPAATMRTRKRICRAEHSRRHNRHRRFTARSDHLVSFSKRPFMGKRAWELHTNRFTGKQAWEVHTNRFMDKLCRHLLCTDKLSNRDSAIRRRRCKLVPLRDQRPRTNLQSHTDR